MSADNLAALLDALTDMSVYVIEEETHKLLYFNERCRETGRGRAVTGAKCHDVWPEVCGCCPLESLGDRKSIHIVCPDPLLHTTVDVTASRIIWDGNIRAIVVTAAPHRLKLEEEQDMRNIQHMYAQSLVTVFDECIIANLTDDYYVNCQKDTLWTDIPEQGSFGVENRIMRIRSSIRTIWNRSMHAFPGRRCLRHSEEARSALPGGSGACPRTAATV